MNRPNFSPMLTVAAAGILALVLAGCQGAGSDSEAGDAPTSSASAATTSQPAAFAPKLAVTQGQESAKITDAAGAVVNFQVNYPVAQLTGVEAGIAEKFATAVASRKDAVIESAQAYSKFTLDECEDSCEREASSVLVHAGIYEDFGTVASTSGYVMGTRDRNPGVHSVTMNLKTGNIAELADFMDLGDPQVLGLATAALKKTENWAYCQESSADYLAAAAAFSPTAEGVLLLWPVNATHTAQCGVEQVIVPWAGADTPKEEAVSEPVAQDINGRWCPTAESAAAEGCVSIALPNATYEKTGFVGPIRHIDTAGGAFNFIGEGAPFGDYYPAGTALELPSYYAGTDLPEQDRIWNSQTGILMLRQ